MKAIDVTAVDPAMVEVPVAPVLPERRKLTPVKWWGAAGAATAALIVYLAIAWVTSPDFRASDPGPDAVPEFMKVAAVILTVIGVPLAVGFVYWFVIRPVRREGRLSFDGMMLIALASTYWQDPLFNYSSAALTYNAGVLPDWGSWSMHVPGWQAPNGDRYAEPLIWAIPVYIYVLMGGVLIACAVMRRANRRWPKLGRLGLFGVAFATLAAVDFLSELVFMRLGIYSYPGTLPLGMVFEGEYYQFPVVEAFLWGGLWATWAYLRFFRDDKGRSIVERGSERLRVGARARTAIRLLAVVGACNLAYLVLYNVPIQWFTLHQGEWISEIREERSYFRSELCGAGTGYACPNRDLPTQRHGAARVDEQGRIAPD